MSPNIATVFYILVILGLFWLDRDKNSRTSPGLWISVAWVSIACTRSVTQWLGMDTPIESSSQILEGSPIDRLVQASLLAVGLIVLANRRRQVWAFLRANKPILLFIIYCAVSILWSDYPGVAFKRWTKLLGDFVIVLVVLSDREQSEAVKRLLARTTYLLIPLSVLFIEYYPDIGKGYDETINQAYYRGVTDNKNSLGLICLLFGLGAVWRLVVDYQARESMGRKRRLIAHSVVLAMVLWLFWIADSMTPLCCFLLACPLVLAANMRVVARRPARMHLLIAAVVSVSISALFFTTGLLQTIGRNATLTDRTGLWASVFSMATNPWLGTGFESFWLGPRLDKLWSLYPWHPIQAHNGYIEIFLNLGWAGIFLLAVVIAAGYRTVIASLRRNRPTASLMLAYFVAGLVYNCTEAAIFRILAPASIFLLLAITSSPEPSSPEIELCNAPLVSAVNFEWHACEPSFTRD